jgi:hypothetical protein
MNKLSQTHLRYGYDIGEMFIFLNILLFAVTILFYSIFDFPSLVNQTTLIIYFLLFLQLHFFLSYERGRRNPFILILAFVIIFFFFTRIITISLHDVASYSGVLERIRDATVDDINHVLIFIFAANWMIFLGLCKYKEVGSTFKIEETNKTKLIKVKNIVIFMSLLMASSLQRAIFPLSDVMNGSSFFSISGYLFSESHLLIFALVIYYLPTNSSTINSKRLLTYWTKIIVVMLILFVTIRVFYGSRSALLSLVQVTFFVFLAIERFSVSKKIISLLLVFSLLAFPLFSIATNLRESKADLVTADLFSFMSAMDYNKEKVAVAYVPAFDRMAYLDFSVDLIKNSDQYYPVVNVAHMLKSVLDGGLTPGFNIFDIPLSANALEHIYRGKSGQLTRTPQVDEYQSDQFNVYGEYYVIFSGWLSLPFFAIAAFIFQWVYSRISFKSHFRQIVWRTFLLSIFMQWMTSFGSDWIFTFAIQNSIMILFWMYVLEKRFSISGEGGSKLNIQK